MLARPVRPQLRHEAEDDILEEAEQFSSGHGTGDEMENSSDDHEDEDEDDWQELSDPPDEHNDQEVQQQINNVSFESLLKAQQALSKKRKRDPDATSEQEEKLSKLRARLQLIRGDGAMRTDFGPSKGQNGRSRPDEKDVEEESDDSSAPSEEGATSKSRLSKHAPSAQSSKHQVTRKRTVIDVPKRVTRDPRFDAMYQDPSNTVNREKAYDFLWDYRNTEITELKAAIKATKNDDDKQTLRRKLNSMENRIKSKVAKEREQEVVRSHRKEERERIKEGKTPYYLKQKEVKDRALVEKFKGMKGKERERLLERRRVKESQKEKRKMPQARRSTRDG